MDGPLPNIILIGGDGLNAANFSVYGYGRDTTPYIRRLAPGSLLGENHFSNSPHSTGSDTALLTGKSPFTTRVLYPPDILRGADKYQHLPALLKQAGYHTASMGVPYFMDVNTIDFLNAFDEVNCNPNPSNLLTDSLAAAGYSNEIYFFSTMQVRLSERLGHIFFLQDMQNPYASLTRSGTVILTDQQRMDCLRRDLDEASQSGRPLFAHVHLLNTHGPEFYPATQVFSRGEMQDQAWMVDFYDDAILEYDAQVQELVQYLKDSGQYDHTILVLYSDHPQQWKTAERIPLLIHFPGDAHAGAVAANTQNIDVAPTLLDYLGMQIPAWMEGNSLLGSLDPARLITIGGTDKIQMAGEELALSDDASQPPFYQFSQLTVIQCRHLYRFDLKNGASSESWLSGRVDPCPAETVEPNEVIHRKVEQMLTARNYQLPDGW